MNSPFERNNYFWGKLLSAEDFQAEQRYFNGKRQLLNRVVYGSGVLNGLEIIKLDDKKILIQAGIALDCTGREVMLPEPVTRNISLIAGFSYENRQGFSYLCIAYEEKPWQEAVVIETGGETQYNRILEGAKLYFTQTPPNTGEDSHVYLAKVVFVVGENTFVIESAEDVRHMLLECSAEQPDSTNGDILKGIEDKIEKVLREYVQLTLMRSAVTSGVETIDFGLGAKRGRVFFSAPITHGMGGGAVSVNLGAVNQSSESKTLGGQSIIYGNPDIFETDYLLASKVNAVTGTFVIGVRLLHDTLQTQVKVFWTAVRGGGDGLPGPADTCISIKPHIAHIRCREIFPFSIEGISIDKRAVIWSVAEPDGGTVDQGGVYRAPNKPGIFEIRAEADGRKAVAFAMVKY